MRHRETSVVAPLHTELPQRNVNSELGSQHPPQPYGLHQTCSLFHVVSDISPSLQWSAAPHTSLVQTCVHTRTIAYLFLLPGPSRYDTFSKQPIGTCLLPHSCRCTPAERQIHSAQDGFLRLFSFSSSWTVPSHCAPSKPPQRSKTPFRTCCALGHVLQVCSSGAATTLHDLSESINKHVSLGH